LQSSYSERTANGFAAARRARLPLASFGPRSGERGVPKFNLDVPHNLSADEAKSRLERFIEMLKSQHGDKVSDLEQSWAGNKLSFGFKTYGFKIGGAIESLDNRLAVSGDIPFAAMMFKGKIESEIREQLGRLMG
jgi:hypothetical protein